MQVRNNVLGHLQQGNRPSPLDRCRAIVLAIAATDDIVAKIKARSKDGESHGHSGRFVYANDDESAVLCGLEGEGVKFTPISKLLPGDHALFCAAMPSSQ